MQVLLPLLALSLCAAFGCRAASSVSATSSPVDFAFRQGDQLHSMSELRGRPVVVVLVRTSDIASMAYMAEVKRSFEQTAGKLRYVVLSIEPTEEPLLQTFTEAEELPFPLGLAAADVGRGTSALGLLPTLPMTYLVDETGRIKNTAAGVVRSEDIVRELERLRLINRESRVRSP